MSGSVEAVVDYAQRAEDWIIFLLNFEMQKFSASKTVGLLLWRSRGTHLDPVRMVEAEEREAYRAIP